MSAAPRLTVISSQEWPYRFEVLGTESLFIDESYQRPLSRFVKEIIDGFDPALVGSLVVSERVGRKAKYAVVDGQTRLVALKQLGQPNAPCLVYSGLSRAQEASMFARLQTERKSMRPFHRFRAAVVAENPESLAIETIVKACGFELSDNAGVDTIAAISAVEAAYRRAPEILERTLTILYTAWSRRKHAATGEVIRGLAYFLQITPNADDDKLVRRFSIVDPSTLTRRASALREGRGHGGNSPRYMAEAIAAMYRSRKQPEAA